MCKIKLYKNDIDKLFNIYNYGFPKTQSHCIVLINEDIKEFIKTAKIYYFDDMLPITFVINIVNIYDNLSFLDESFKLIAKSPMKFYDNEGIIIEFPDEETAFYFKLKFC